MARHHETIYNPCPTFLFQPPKNLNAMFCDQKAPGGSDNASNVWHCCSRTPVESRKISPQKIEKSFRENYFLIEAHATDMTDKLAIVKSLSCGVSQTACVLLVLVFQL